MAPLLLTLLAIAIAITIAGYFLSAKMQARDPQALYYSGRLERRRAATQRMRRTTTADESTLTTTGRVPLRASANLSTSMLAVGAGQIGTIAGQRGWKLPPWTMIAGGLICTFVLFFYLLGTLLPHQPLLGYLSLASSGPAATATAAADSPVILRGASLSLVRVGQVDPSQYNTQQEFNTWAYSACSAAAMTEVINAYGYEFRVIDILKVESRLHEITPELGLLEDVGIARTVAQFGFKTSWGHNFTLDQVIAVANSGTPVIVSFPPDRYAGGHLLVVKGGSGNYVYLADSSLYDRHSLTRPDFMKWWGGFYAIVTPK
jgi:hypothetical protein